MPTDHDTIDDSTEFDLESVDISEVFEGVRAVLLAPVLLPLVSTVNQPLVKAMIREGIAFSERCQDAVADAQERLDDILAEAQAEAEAQRRSPRTDMKRADTHGGETGKTEPLSHESFEHHASGRESSESSTSSQGVLVQREPRLYGQPGEVSQAASQIGGTVEELNAQLRWLTNDTLDLRMLATTALGAFALRQMIVRGLRLDEIPWYVAAWYALDTFVKFHPNVIDTGASPQPSNATRSPSPQTIDIQ